jgi:serine/threonine protein kinase
VLDFISETDGRYQLIAKIGAGGSSEVWSGRDQVLDRPVAVKLLLAGFTAEEESLRRFRDEARHAGLLSHENVARIYDYCDPAERHPPYLVMELVEGESLATALERRGAIGASRTLDIIVQAASGLHAAHEAGLIHRDIKPGNLMVSKSGTVKITDFGISQAAEAAPLTRTGIVVGSAGYLAPERASGARATIASDIYALGVVAYECLRGTPPFSGSALEVALAHCQRPLPPLSPSVPPELAELVGDLTAKDPGARPASAAEVASRAADLHGKLAASETAVLPEVPLGAAEPKLASSRPRMRLPISPLPRLSRLPRRTKRLAVGAGAGAVAILIGLIAFSLPGTADRHAGGSPAGTNGQSVQPARARHGHSGHGGQGHGDKGHGHGNRGPGGKDHGDNGHGDNGHGHQGHGDNGDGGGNGQGDNGDG